MRVTIVVGLVAGCAGHHATPADGTAADTSVVVDPIAHITWLADANLASTDRFGLPLCPASPACVNPSGTMSYSSAVAWVTAMNAASYLGHADWQLPTTPMMEQGCTSTGPNGASFAFSCKSNALATLYFDRFGLDSPATAVALPPAPTAPFENFQPYLYWTGTEKVDGQGKVQGNASLSFATGFQGANTQYNFLYVMPMLQGQITGAPMPNGTGLQVDPDGNSVYDPIAQVTWPVDANLGASNTFGLQRCTAWNAPSPCVAADGAMDLASATAFIAAMNTASYLHMSTWTLPPADLTCDASFGCTGTNNPLSELYYGQLKRTAGTPIAATPPTTVAGFSNVQPYLYWSCQGQDIAGPCAGEPAASFQWSFSFGDGFLGTDLDKNELYVAVYRVGG